MLFLRWFPNQLAGKKRKQNHDKKPDPAASNKKDKDKGKGIKVKHAASRGASKEVIESFRDEYRPHIMKLPKELQPTSTVHGVHSYTVQVGPEGRGKVEVLLRHQSFKPKIGFKGEVVKAKSRLDLRSVLRVQLYKRLAVYRQ